jgi:ATP synthase subunit 6
MSVSIINTPLEQFDIITLIPLKMFFIDISITNSMIFSCIVFFFIFLVIYMYSLEVTLVPRYYQLVLENIILFIKNLIVENVGSKFLAYFNYIFLLFFFLLFSNLIGMVPYTFTVTSHLILTFTLSFMSFLGINIIGILKHGSNFLSLFLPSGAPLIIAPFLIVIEFISYIARVFSLAIRLFANIMSGHTLLKILSSFGWSMFYMGGIWVFSAFLPLIIVFMVTGLEVAIASLQAYVFTILVCIYLNDALHLH